MKFIGLIKQVFDPAEIKPQNQGPNLNLDNVPKILNPFDEFVVEECLQWKEKLGGDVTIISMGDDGASEILRTALAMGADKISLISDPFGGDGDTIERSKIIAKAIEKEGGADLIIAGKLALGGDTAHVGPMVAAFLNIPVLTYVSKVKELSSDRIVVERLLEGGKEVVSSTLPCLITVVKDINKPRYPSLIAIRKASKMPIPTVSRQDLGCSKDVPSTVKLIKVTPPPPRAGGEIITGTTEEAVAKLLDKLFEQKVF